MNKKKLEISRELKIKLQELRTAVAGARISIEAASTPGGCVYCAEVCEGNCTALALDMD